MTIASKRASAATAATKLGDGNSRLGQRARSERTNKVLQVWRNNVPIRTCTLAARGLWIEMVSIMHDCEPYGHLVVNGEPMTVRQLARIVGAAPRLVDDLLAELWRAGVFGCKDNCIYSPEMVVPSENQGGK